jgi:predicted membrane-bound dolichyl-phosphate-mannose-protein mannosyltransferase
MEAGKVAHSVALNVLLFGSPICFAAGKKIALEFEHVSFSFFSFLFSSLERRARILPSAISLSLFLISPARSLLDRLISRDIFGFFDP